MNHFTTHQSFFLVPLSTYDEEFKKIESLVQDEVNAMIEAQEQK